MSADASTSARFVAFSPIPPRCFGSRGQLTNCHAKWQNFAKLSPRKVSGRSNASLMNTARSGSPMCRPSRRLLADLCCGEGGFSRGARLGGA
eukprot:7325810-Prymnesium_polylepis.1